MGRSSLAFLALALGACATRFDQTIVTQDAATHVDSVNMPDIPEAATGDVPRDQVDAGLDVSQDLGDDAGSDVPRDSGNDVGFDAGLDVPRDSGNDAGFDAGFDVPRDSGNDVGFDVPRDSGNDTGPMCQPGSGDCDSNPATPCVPLNTIEHCGACGRACAAPTGGTASCTAGACQSLCPAGSTLCGNRCVMLQTDVEHCGACGNRCALPSASARCNAGSCAIASCQGGNLNCDTSVANGCETAAQSDPQNCGSCGRTCMAWEACMLGMCRPRRCPDGYSIPRTDFLYYLDASQQVQSWQAYCLPITLPGQAMQVYTLVLKADGNSQDFTYDSRLWNMPSQETYANQTAGVAPTADARATNALFRGFYSIPASQVVVEFEPVGSSIVDNVQRIAAAPVTSRNLSLHQLVNQPLSAQASSMPALEAVPWEAALSFTGMPPFAMNRACAAAGFNVGALNHSRARIGIITNNENDCGSTPDSRAGVGLTGNFSNPSAGVCGQPLPSGVELASGGVSGCTAMAIARRAHTRVYVR
ncbi:MAG: hypothetical protein JNK72_23930 [Myxococcales bacterium]|nr:hypothetical protein [Myxococcales bacterium]